ncbi:uncharacterized protein K02A2.6-like [Polypterus senegalus]|nr:uncharacterized protein K02A2.6-like [Polypterus senegalus]
MYLVVVDAHSKWPEVQLMDSVTTSKTVHVMRTLFSRYGIPEVLVSDNGPQFISDEFAYFMKTNHIKHIRSAPYHPATNGLAERFVQTFKQALKASKGSALVQQRLDTFLLSYRNTPHATTQESPAMLFMGRKLRSRLDVLKPNVASTVSQSQDVQLLHSNRKSRQFNVGDPVLVRDYRRGEKWTPGVVTSQLGPVSYSVKVGNAEDWKRHADQLLLNRANESVPQATQPEETPSSNLVTMSPVTLENNTVDAGHNPTGVGSVIPDMVPQTSEPQTYAPPTSPTESSGRRYPLRVSKPPDRLNL